MSLKWSLYFYLWKDDFLLKDVIGKYLKNILSKKRKDSVLKRTSISIPESLQLKCSNFHQDFSSFKNKIIKKSLFTGFYWSIYASYLVTTVACSSLDKLIYQFNSKFSCSFLTCDVLLCLTVCLFWFPI